MTVLYTHRACGGAYGPTFTMFFIGDYFNNDFVWGRAYVTPDDVKAMRHEVMRHRIMLNFAAIADGVKEETIIDAIVGAIVTP